jgi:hypothetical protein
MKPELSLFTDSNDFLLREFWAWKRRWRMLSRTDATTVIGVICGLQRPPRKLSFLELVLRECRYLPSAVLVAGLATRFNPIPRLLFP